MSSLQGAFACPSLWLPILVFLAEMCVVTLGTIRIIFVSRGMRVLAPLLGFFEIVIWLFAIGQIMKNLSNAWCYMAFAAGFTIGNFFGVIIEKRLALGTVVLRIVSNKNLNALIEKLLLAGYGVTTLDGHGSTGPVKVVLSVVKRKELGTITELLRTFDPGLFYSIENVQAATEGIFPLQREVGPRASLLKIFRAAA